jgi:hypothetical protein
VGFFFFFLKKFFFFFFFFFTFFFLILFWGGGGGKLYNHKTFYTSNEAHHSVTETATGWTTISTFKPTGGTR